MRCGRLALATALAAVALGIVGPAFADADPASDVLLQQDIFFPYEATVSPDVAHRLQDSVRSANTHGYRIKIAVIATRTDLGGVTSLYRKPRLYARFLGFEIKFMWKGRLLVVMPNGFGYYHGKRPTARAMRVLRKVKIAPGGDGLVNAATKAVRRLRARGVA